MNTKLPIDFETDGTSTEVRALQSASLAGGAVPRRVLLAPWGRVESTHGSFVVDDESARLAIEAFEAHGTDLPIDYEHQTLGGVYSSPNGQAPAAGWIKRVEAVPGVGLLADIEWTEQGERMLGAKEYRYLSPVAVIRKTDRRLIAVHSAALTNKPAIRGMEAIVNRDSSPPSAAPVGSSFPPYQGGTEGGLESTSSAADRVAGDGADADVAPMALLRTELNMPEESEVEEVLLAASRRLVALREEANRRHVEQRMEEAIRAGKLVEAQRTWAEALVAREEGLFDEWLRTAPVIVRTGRSAPPEGSAVANGERNRAARARAEYRSSPLLARLTSEEAYVAMAAGEGQN